MERETLSNKFPLGSRLPSFKLKNIDERQIGDDYLRSGKLALVVFTCNHCPYVKGSEAMLIQVVKEHEKSGLRTVTISSNDAKKYPEDSFENMKEKAQTLLLPYPYLHDESQEVARLFDAQCTPECYLFDSSQKLIYHGGINDNPKDSSQAKANYLARALGQAFKGEKVEPGFVHPLGCSIKWK